MKNGKNEDNLNFLLGNIRVALSLFFPRRDVHTQYLTCEIRLERRRLLLCVKIIELTALRRIFTKRVKIVRPVFRVSVPIIARMDAKFNRIKIEDLLNDNSNSALTNAMVDAKVECRLKGCQMTFKNHEALQTHEERFHKIGARHICEICNTTFSSLPNRNKHVRTQKKIFQHQWLHVGIFFIIVAFLEKDWHYSSGCIHLQVRSVHDKQKPFKCSKCTSAFGFKDGLKRHEEMVHQQLRPYSCSKCNQTFKTKSHMNTHIRNVHPWFVHLENKRRQFSFC